MNLKTYYKNILYEAGCDEAGRGPLAGPVFAAAVILDPNQEILGLNDSKKLNEKERNILRTEIESKALCWSVCKLEPIEIDQINILQASLKAMRFCLLDLKIRPTSIIIDGNKKIPHLEIEQYCICLLYTSDAADERSSVDLGGRRIIKKKKQTEVEV